MEAAELSANSLGLGIGDGISGGRPLGTVILTGIPSTIFSFACIAGGILIALPLLLYVILSNQAEDTLFLQASAGVGIALFVIGFLFAAIIQLAMSVENTAKRSISEHDDE